MSDDIKSKQERTHDELFQKVYGDPEEAVAFFKENLPASLVNKIDWSTLEHEKKSYIDQEMQKSESDLLYSVKLKESRVTIRLYFLFEHQSTPDKWLRYRLLKYEVRIWEDVIDQYRLEKDKSNLLATSGQKDDKDDLPSLKEEIKGKVSKKPKSRAMPNQLPAIVPVVFYQGKDRWRYSTEFTDLINFGDLEKGSWLPSFSHFLVDQSDMGVEKFSGELKGKVVQLLMKIAHHGLIDTDLQTLIHWLVLIQKLHQDSAGTQWVPFFIQYFVQVYPDLSLENLLTALEQEEANHLIKGDIMNLFERMEEKAREEADEKSKFQIAKNMLQEGFNWEMILKLTGLSQEKFQELAAKLEDQNQVKSA